MLSYERHCTLSLLAHLNIFLATTILLHMACPTIIIITILVSAHTYIKSV